MNLLECVPNFSEGRSREVVESLAESVRRVAGVRLLHVTRDADHHRSVLTFAGTPEGVLEAALSCCSLAVERIDLSQHHGVHPRIGAVDVVPFVPLENLPMARAVAAAHEFGRRFATSRQVPVFFYGDAARTPERAALEVVRRGGYEGLSRRLKGPAWAPDEGPREFSPRTGATAVGARKVLIAFNVNLDADDLEAAREIARAVRARDGGLPAVKSLGLPLPRRGMVQVSVNLVDYTVTPWERVVRRILKEAADRRVRVSDLEIIGMVPRAAADGLEACGVPLPAGWRAQVLEEALGG